MGFFRFPVNFISIERELENVLPYLKGRVLNAGCGNRDITDFLKKHRVSGLDNCDIQSAIPGAIMCDLTAIPKQDKYYDSILCNAVLEHVPYPERVMREFGRLLKDGGYLVVSVPFLQPYHPTPFDYRRYTREGLIQLAELTGFKVVQIKSVHTLAQTLGWLIWANLEERRSILGKLLLWLPIYALSRIFTSGSSELAYSANSFQVVMVKN